jgi:hypothetical protein
MLSRHERQGTPKMGIEDNGEDAGFFRRDPGKGRIRPPGAFALATSAGRPRSEFVPHPGAGEPESDPFRRARIRTTGGARATRKPRLLFRFAGEFLLRFADRQFWPLLFQLPPRMTRLTPFDRSPPLL